MVEKIHHMEHDDNSSSILSKKEGDTPISGDSPVCCPVPLASDIASDDIIISNEAKNDKQLPPFLPTKKLPTFEVCNVSTDQIAPFLPSKDTLLKEIDTSHCSILDWLKGLLSKNESLPFAKLATDSSSGKVLRVSPLEKADNFWFFGDIHGDLLAFETAVNYAEDFSIKNRLSKPVIVLLGDLVDRLRYDYEVLVRLLERIRNGSQFIWLAGNHDSIRYDERSKHFIANVSPSELCDWLNSDEEPSKEYHTNAHNLMILLTKIIPEIPVAIYFSDGTLVAHGAVPHKDISSSIESWEDLSKESMVNDFTWCRLHPTKRMTVVNRSTKGCQIGINEFDQFCEIMETRLKAPIQAFIRGHDHYAERYKHYEKYNHALILTINTISCTLDGCDPFGQVGYVTKPVILQYRPNISNNNCLATSETTEENSTNPHESHFIVHCLEINHMEVENWYPNPATQMADKNKG